MQEPAHLSSLRSETEAAFPEGAHMVSGHVQGRLFATLARLIGAQSVLEIGTFTGYSALAFAEGLPEVSRRAAHQLSGLIQRRTRDAAHPASGRAMLMLVGHVACCCCVVVAAASPSPSRGRC